MKLVEHRWVQALWCDDVRTEVGNKLSFMGVYTGELQFPSLPAVMPKLAVHINVGTPRAKLFERLKIRIIRNDETASMAEIDMPEDELKKLNDDIRSKPPIQDEGEPNEPRGISFALLAILGPLTFNTSTRWLKVLVETEDEVLESFKLRIRSQESVTSSLH